MDPLLYLVVAAAVFLLIHVLPSSPLRPAIVARIGENAWLGAFSVVTLLAIVWMVRAYSAAPPTPLFTGLRAVPVVLMPFAFVLLACGVLGRNPTAVGQSRSLTGPDPARGIIRITRHPVMWAIMLWAATHILARGELKSTIFFGAFLLLAAVGSVLQDARKARTLGEDWKRFAALTSNLPFAAIAGGRNRLALREVGWLAPATGVVLFFAVFHLHVWLFGARPY
jgi:uncharacterized membrane protein